MSVELKLAFLSVTGIYGLVELLVMGRRLEIERTLSIPQLIWTFVALISFGLVNRRGFKVQIAMSLFWLYIALGSIGLTVLRIHPPCYPVPPALVGLVGLVNMFVFIMNFEEEEEQETA